MVQNLSVRAGGPVSVSFTPVLVPMSRGILATSRADAIGVPAAEVVEVYEKAYADEPFVHLLPAGQWPTTAATLGANTVLLQVAVDPTRGRVVVVAAIDNLTKGTAGAAVQCLNLALGLPETTGLPTVGSRPVSVTAAAGLPGRRGHRRAQGLRAARRRRSSSTTARRRAAAGVFTTNRVKAAPVRWSQQMLRPAVRLRAVVLNSGGANACTGPDGYQTPHATAEQVAEVLGMRLRRSRSPSARPG